MLIEKPIVIDKFREFERYLKGNDRKIGTKQRGLDINLRNACNLKCEHCFTLSPLGLETQDRLSIEDLARIGDQAHELGIFELDLQGGELLLDKEYLYEALKALKTERFYVYLTTNGYFMDEETARMLRSSGVDRVSVSIDSMDSDTHDKFRGKKGSWERAINALKLVQDQGMTPYMNITVGRYNVDSEDLELMLEYSKDNRYTTLLNVATPGGMWAELESVCINDADRGKLIEMRKKYKNILRNLWDPFDRNREGVIGCNTVNRLYITPKGDVLPCPYVHLKIGNIHQNSLKEISNYGFKVKKFRDNSQSCLAGEDREFIERYMAKDGVNIFNAPMAHEVFGESELYKDDVIK